MHLLRTRKKVILGLNESKEDCSEVQKMAERMMCPVQQMYFENTSFTKETPATRHLHMAREFQALLKCLRCQAYNLQIKSSG